MLCLTINWVRSLLGWEPIHLEAKPKLWAMTLVKVGLMVWARLTLFLMGWHLLDEEMYSALERHERSMVIFSHSSFWDFFIFTLYALSYPIREHKLRTLVTPKPFQYMGNFLRGLGAIESTRVEDSQGGATNRIVAELEQCPKFVFFISPKGTLRNTPWRSGYYHVAKELQLPIFVAGLDYETHRPVLQFNPPIVKESEPDLRLTLQSQLSQIVPLYPEGEVVPIRDHTYRSVVDWTPYLVLPRLVSILIARSLLFITGWSGFTEQQLRLLHRHPRAVVVFSHTSYVDFYLLALYLIAYPKDMAMVRTLVKPEPFAYMGWLLRRFGAIPAARIDTQNGGSLDKIIATLNAEPTFLFFICPKGSILKRPWRSGYYNIAHQLQVPLLVAGLDYETMAPVVTTSIPSSEPLEKIESFLKARLSNIVPLFPEEEIVPIRTHRPPKAIHVWQLGSILTLILTAWLLY